jgi:hypothetical protein
MDQTRQIRFLIPPFILYGSLLWGLYCSDPTHQGWWSLIENSETILPYLSIAAASVLPLGFVIGTISILVLKGGFAFSNHTYETCVSIKCLGQMTGQVGKHWDEEAFKKLSRCEKKLVEHLTEVTFNHGVLKKEWPGVHTWLVRRWNAFNVSAHSICALAVALIAGRVLGLCLSWQWWWPSIVIGAALFLTGREAWRETMAMIAFLAETDFKQVKRDEQA